eukprot:GGOE01048060.1.p3 GENE.GGOE01048060.1~~GGOE01048060.1.p3  ORF type:complete len:119 (-),score=12.17 GGOE01048060.1:152-508(-)
MRRDAAGAYARGTGMESCVVDLCSFFEGDRLPPPPLQQMPGNLPLGESIPPDHLTCLGSHMHTWPSAALQGNWGGGRNNVGFWDGICQGLSTDEIYIPTCGSGAQSLPPEQAKRTADP